MVSDLWVSEVCPTPTQPRESVVPVISLNLAPATKQNIIIAATIHQPDALLWNLFDYSLCLHAGEVFVVGHLSPADLDKEPKARDNHKTGIFVRT